MGNKANAALKFLCYSLFGLFMFFCPLTLGTKTTIPVDHIISFLIQDGRQVAEIYILLVMYAGVMLPFLQKTWNKDALSVFFSIAKVCGAIAGTVLYFNVAPQWLMQPSFGPFLFNKLALPVGLVIPIGSIFLAFLSCYGLMEFTGVLMSPIMRPIFKTPGRAAIDAVASFVGSYSIALLITNGIYRQGKYSAKEAAIVATGFSTVSATFLLIVAKTLGLMEHWALYFWVAMTVTFIVTAITARIWPLASMPESYFTGERVPDPARTGNIFVRAWSSAVETAGAVKPLGGLVLENFSAGLKMAFTVVPSIMSVGLLGLVLAEYTPLFDIAGYLFYPFFAIFGVAQPFLAGKAAAVSLPEMFLPAILAAKSATPLLKFVVGVVSIAEILFFSASIPCILGTDVPLKLGHILVIWFERVILSILITVPIAMFLGFADVVVR